ncbi:DUF3237 domain-containing protein [Metarhizobium album]|uniref:UPF0311 protein DEM27_11735 n=1 Tax=Metarhizobium album TaxID=2182425 RepID=A0A2U2DS04_9HYPH|nr:DUF3237 family protein [Rhizobium album]PWE56103.1 DUF3237 domain-containing protein [Rhizobium album]
MTTADPRLSFVAELAVTIAEPYMIGNVGPGIREVIPITGGTVTGPRLNGIVLPGGADWCLTRPDGICDIWARYTLKTDDGVLISLVNAGTCGQDAEGNFVGKTVPQFEVEEGPYTWLRHGHFVGTLLTDAGGTLARARLYEVM